MLTCRDFVDFLMAYLSGELPAGQRAVFEEHLGECPDCTTYLYSYEQTVRIGSEELEPGQQKCRSADDGGGRKKLASFQK